MNVTRDEIYDMLSNVLTNYEEGLGGASDLYSMLVDIQGSWETIITCDDSQSQVTSETND